MTADGSPFNNSYQYRADGLMSGSNGAAYTYDALGQRVQKVYGSTTTEYIYFGGLLLAEYNPGSNSWTDRIYGPGGALATVAGTQNAVPVYRLSDHLGSLGLSTTSNTTSGITGVASSLPFGEMTINSGGDNFPFTDHERDGENSTDATLFRHYAPTQLRWLSPDPYNGSYDLSDPQSLNRYAYLTNRPMSATDPTGLDNCITVTIVGGSGSITGCSGGSGGGGNGPIDSGWDAGDGSMWGSDSGPTVSMGIGGGSLGGSYYSMPSSYGGTGSNVTADSSGGSSGALDVVQTLLGVGGMIPEIGVVFNGINAGIDIARGNWGRAALDGGLTLASVVPMGAIGLRGLQALHLADEALEAAEVAKTAGQLGEEGEAAVREAYDIGEKEAIDINGRTRIPDGYLRGQSISEVKNTAYQSYSQQLRDYNQFAQQNGVRFDLYTRSGGRLSGPLESLRGNGYGGTINIMPIP
jgi:RHS repeat-associated protein